MKNQFYNIIFSICFSVLITHNVNAQLLTVSGKKIINSTNNQEVVLNAMNFGNWMVMEGYMMNSVNQATDQHTWKQKLNTLIGSTNTNTFYNAWLANYVTLADIQQIKAWGFNAVRLPIHYEYFVNSGTPDVWNNQGFTILDNLISWCSAEGIYVIIDLHAAPGGQSNNNICDYDSTKPSLWESPANKTKTVELWRKISFRYKLESWVAGYDLINEPAWNLPGGTDLRNIYGDITNAIRANGDNHILFIEGNWYANDFTGLTPAWDANLVYSFHNYWANVSPQDIKWITDFRTAQNRPIWCGEQGENSNDHFAKTVETFSANNIGFSWWPMKKFVSINDFANAQWPTGYTNLLNYLGGTNPSLNPTTAFNTVMQLAENIKLANCTLQSEVIRSIFTQPGNRNTEPFSINTIPGRLYTANYDQGMNGYAYSDRSWEDLHGTTGNNTAWNNGWAYRNNGVDVTATSDFLSNGYTIGWFTTQEWMKYTVNVASAGTYSMEFRVSNGNATAGTMQIQNADGTQILATINVPATGGWESWQTITTTGGFALSGSQAIRIVNMSGEFNVNSVNFVYLNSNIPTINPVVPIANIIYLKGNNGKYVTYSGSTNLMSSTSATLGANEKFTIVDAGNGLIALKGSNGKYVNLSPTLNTLSCNATTIGLYQKFTLNDLCGAYSIQGYNNLYVSSENGATSGLTCTRTTPAAWEFFNWDITGVEVLSTKSFEDSTEKFKLFPNPAQNFITIDSLLDEKVSITIYDLNGREIMKKDVVGIQKNIDISQIQEGVYFMKITGLEKTETIQFIKNSK
jgi:endoglucanase